MESTNKLLIKEKEFSIKYTNQLDILYNLLEHDEYLLFNDGDEDMEDDEEDDDEEYEDNERADVNSEAPTEVDIA
jgi:hypothetical protein